MAAESSPLISKVFSVRIVSIDYYMAPPIPDTDICYSSFQGGKVNEVPVIRVYGSTPGGQKCCLHIHRAFPYFYVPCSDISPHMHQAGDKYTDALCQGLEKALKLRGSAGLKRQHVHGCSVVRARRFYGYHPSEELFLKIYLYYPHDVSRAANLLLGGAVLDRSIQPHESHIPFLLQFLVDYNLYGMAHVHLSKMKFRNPVPDVFTSRKFSYDSQERVEDSEERVEDSQERVEDSQERVKDSQERVEANLSGGGRFDYPMWTSSTVPGDWKWQFSSQFCTLSQEEIFRVKRQSVCELEGDAILDDILNQQFKMYTSLSQAHSDVKMVQSLIPIWEEEYERTGMHEVSILPDPGKPFPHDVLKVLSNDIEFERKLSELCGKTEENLPFVEENVISQQPMSSSADEENLVNSNNTIGEHLTCSAEEIIKSLSLRSSIGEEEMGTTSTRMKDACPQLFSSSEMRSSEIIGSLDLKAADTEAMGLLRWLATSQAAEEINSDDELIHETILSPLMPAATIDQVLEKANIEYESQSQKECQDILDSIDFLINSEDFQDKTSHSVDHRNYTQASTKTKISLVDLPSSPSGLTRKSSKTDKKRESERQVLGSTGMGFTAKRIRRSLWGSLPFSMSQRDDETDASRSNIVDANHVGGGKSCVATAEYKDRKCSDSLTANEDIEDYEAGVSIERSVRDLMRRKRHQRVAQQDCGFVGIAKAYSGGEKGEPNILLKKRLDLPMLQNDDHDKKALAYVNIDPSVPNQQTQYLDVPPPRCIDSISNMRTTTSFMPCSNIPLQGGTHTPSMNTGPKDSQCHDNSMELYSTITMVDCKSKKDLPVGDVIDEEAKNSNVNEYKSELLSDNWLFKDAVSADKRLEQKDAASSSLIPDSLQEYESCAAKRGGYSDLSVVGSLVTKDVKSEENITDLVGMTFSRKPPMAEWKDGASDCALTPAGLFCHPSLFDKDNEDGTTGCALNELKPFFGELQVEEEVEKETLGNSGSVQQEAVMGVPTYFQNDGSPLYLLTPVFSPPSADCVSQWFLLNEGFSQTALQSSSPVTVMKDLPEPGHPSHVIPVLNQAQEETNLNCHAESRTSDGVVQRMLQDEVNNAKMKKSTDCSVDMSQISGPDGRSRPTPLSQIGFRDPASVGAGQQLTLLSIEVQAESRGDLRPDPRFDAINIVCLAFQNDSDSAVLVYVLLRINKSNAESFQRSSDGLSGCKVLVFSEEKHLFSDIVRIIHSIDPDVLMGWDVQAGSLGFLAERAAHLGIGLLNKISRTPSESNITLGETEISNEGIPDAFLQESIITDSVLVEDAIIEDEWGRTHASGVHVGGRVVLNAWRIMRGEVKLNMYTVEAVGEVVLRRKIPSIPFKVLTKWFSSGPGQARYRCIDYVVQRAKLNLEIMNQLDLINRTSELARIFGIDFFSVLSRGSQYRVESMFLRLAHSQNYLAVSPGSQQVASQPAMECLPLVMEPESGFYADPVVVLDFQSLYPSMIIAYNLCFCTCLGNLAPSKANTLGVTSFSPDPKILWHLKDKVLLTPNGVMHVPSEVRKGVLPRLLEEILSTRIMVKQAMKKLPSSQQVLHRIFNARQLALKMIANVTYGYTAAGFSGRMPCAELADSIVQCGRSTLEKAISLVNANDQWKAKVIYGDTDSMFVLLKGRTVKEAFQIGREIASAVTAMNPDPITLKFEKVYHPCFLLTKKRYVGYSYESVDQIEPVFDAKGIETVRRDTCGAVAKVMEQSLRLFFESQNIFKVKTYLHRQWTRILSGRASLQDFIFAKEVRLGTYSTRFSSSLPPAAIVATKAMKADPRAEPRYGERVPYVVIHGEPGARLVDMVVDPLELLAIDSPYRLNDIYYINKQIIPALQRVFGLTGVDLNQWFLDMPRPGRETYSKRTSFASNPQRTRIDYYYLSQHCMLCGELVHASAHICNECLKNETAVTMAVIGRTSKLEREMHHLAAICRHCGGGDWLVESGVKCTSLSCSVFYERRKVQKELQGISAVATDMGFYPKCTVEWF